IYYAMIENLDQNMGKLATFLDDAELTATTTVVFTADHGECNGSHGRCEKQNHFEVSAGIPLIMAGPQVPEQTVLKTPTCTEDLFPTFLGLTELPGRDDLPGADLSPLIRGEATTIDRPGVMLEFVSETRPSMLFHQAVYRAFRSERYKY